MHKIVRVLFILLSINLTSQTQNLNNPLFENNLRRAQLNGKISNDISFTPDQLHQVTLRSVIAYLICKIIQEVF